ncbi:myotubularin-related protein 2-like [Watersipora subatra]|uniref:myotubularin-related protein 2-like n=1 Tax=Watersipora subatra TaxID=2589382 RepID=UPI00355AD84D
MVKTTTSVAGEQDRLSSESLRPADNSLVGKEAVEEEHLDAFSESSGISNKSNTGAETPDATEHYAQTPDAILKELAEENAPVVVGKMNMLKLRDEAIIEDDALLPPLIPLLPGEELCRIGRTLTDDVIMLTTFRLFVTYSKSFVNVILGLIESVECTDITGLQVFCKDGTVRSVALPTSDLSFKWLKAIKQEMAHVQSFTDYFAVSFYVTSTTKKNTPWNFQQQCRFKLGEELRRLGFDLKRKWRITNINEKFEYCASYPRENVVPKSFGDEALERAGVFRSRQRFPSAVWRHKESGAVLLRSSQPCVGVFCQRSKDDEDLVQAIIESCDECEGMLIVDARPYTNAIGNRAKGGGWEFPDYYSKCEVEFMNMPNIHAVRTSFTAVRTLVSTPGDPASWYSRLNTTNWIQNLSTLLMAGSRVASSLASRPVLVHCSDGWDRTPQICALAQILLDPYYRTFKGFQVLIIKEWLEFGHKFAERCGNGPGELDSNEFSPIFLQWLDAVYQLTRQFPTAFEFNELCLVRLVHHTYSRMFGTFLFNNEKERQAEKMHQETTSVWSVLEAMKSELINRLYTPGLYKVLDPSSHPRDLQLWATVYSPAPSQMSSPQEEVHSLQRSQSYSDISVSTESNLHITSASRRLSDTDLTSSINLDECASNPAGIAIPSQPLPSVSNELIAHSFSSSPIVKLSLDQRSRNNSSASMREWMQPKSQKPSIVLDSSHYAKYLAMDGLTKETDAMQLRMNEIADKYEREIEKLKKQIVMLRGSTANGHVTNGSLDMELHHNGNTHSPVGSSGSDQSDEGWEDVSVRESTVTLWIPDHAVSHCCACHSPFKMYRRKHHCRQCGLVFCIACAGQFIEIPEQQLYEPVRVCVTCYHLKIKAKEEDCRSGKDTTCTGNDTVGSATSNSLSHELIDSMKEPLTLDPYLTSSPVGSPARGLPRDIASRDRTCGHESRSASGGSEDKSLLMDARG